MMKKVVLFLATVTLGHGASAEIVASEVSCYQLKAAITSGETRVIGKNGIVYHMVSECGATHIFKTANGLCPILVKPSPSAYCAGVSDSGGYDNSNGGGS